MLKRMLLGLSLSLVMAGSTLAVPITSRSIEYSDGNIVMEGFYACPANVKKPVPGILLVHAWKGLGDYEKSRAKEMAEWGYAVLAVDIYGKGVRPQTTQEAGTLATLYKKDRTLMRARAKSGLDLLINLPNVDSSRIVATGFCFGGCVALELARSGAPLAGVASFHGSLDTPTPADAKNIRGSVLVMHGADDPFVPEEQVAAFKNEMKDAQVDWQILYLGNAVHAFSDPGAGNNPQSGAAYNPLAAKRSMAEFHDFVDDVVSRSNK